MFPFLIYSLESAICLVVLLLPYWVWFRTTTFHQWNRFYLLGAVLFSLSVPLLNIEIETSVPPEIPNLAEDFSLFEEVPQVIGSVPEETGLFSEEITTYTPPNNEKAVISERETHWGLSEILTAIYFLGFLIFTSLFFFRFAKLFWLIRNAKKYRRGGSVFVHLSGKQVFSFFNHIFFDQDRYRENELATLLRHEQVHIQQWHSLDVLMLEILQVIFWFNPLYRIYRKLLQQEHEFFVDAATSKEMGQPQYAQMLLSLAVAKPPLVGHAFAYIPVKHRIFKLFQKPSTTMEKSKFFTALPIVFSLFLVFSCSMEELNSSTISEVIPYTGKKVSEIKTFFKDGQSSIGQEKEAITMSLNKDGTVADIEVKEYPIFTEDIPEYDWSEVYTLFEQSPINNFLLNNIQWLVGEDADIRPICLKAILYSSNAATLKAIDKTFSTRKVRLNPVESENESLMKRMRIFENESLGEDSVIEESSNSEIKYRSKTNRSVKRDIQANDLGNIGQILNTAEHTHTWYQKEIDSGKILAGGFGMNKNIVKLDVSYGDDGSIAEMRYDYTYKTQYEYSYGINDDGKRASEEKYTNIFRFINDEHRRIKTLEISNTEGISLRKYRFYYNEAGYCTKKECINREGSVEFSVRFAYEFYD